MPDGHQYTDELREVKVDIGELRSDLRKFIETQKEHNSEIKQLLAGSEYGEDGLVKKHIKLEERVESLENFRNKVIAYAAGVGAGSGAAVAGLFKLLSG